jgi:hypothetical protein
MTPKIPSAPNTSGLLPSRAAAKILRCTPDYVAKLCRDGKLSCVRDNSAWFVEKDSIARFRRTRQVLKEARAVELVQLRRHEQVLLRGSDDQPQRRPPRDVDSACCCRPAFARDNGNSHYRTPAKQRRTRFPVHRINDDSDDHTIETRRPTARELFKKPLSAASVVGYIGFHERTAQASLYTRVLSKGLGRR